MHIILSLAIAAFGFFSIFAPVARAGEAAADTIILKSAQYLDVRQGKLISPAVIVVRDGEIAEINPAGEPAEGAVIELGDLTILPGLIDAHTHITLDLERGWRYDAVTKTAGDLALIGASNAERTLLAGFTTIRDLGAAHYADIAVARAIEIGIVPGPTIIASGHAIGITGGHCDATGYAPHAIDRSVENGVGDGPDELVKAVRRQIKYGASVIKICATAGVMSRSKTVGAQQPSFEEMKSIVDEAHRQEMKVAAHAVGADGIETAIRAGVDSIEHVSMMTPQLAKLGKKNGVYAAHTLYLFDAIDPASLPPAQLIKGQQIRDASRESFKTAIKENMKIAFATDAGVFPHGDNAKEFATRVGLGQSPLEAIRSATIYAAELLDLSDRGAIEQGLRADLIAVEGDPLDDITVLEDVSFVLKNGRVYKRD